jgi:RNA polymerase sigma-32 factor
MSIDVQLQRFIDRAKRAPRLSREDELGCIQAWQAQRDRRAAGRVIEANARHVVFAALKFKNYGVAVADLISVGNLGLMQALERFDASKGARFGTYAAYWIRDQLVSEVLESWSLLSGPRGALDSRIFFRLRRERACLEAQVEAQGSAPEPQSVMERLADSFGVAPHRMEEMLAQLDHRGVSLDALAPGQNQSLLDQLRSDQDQAAALESCQEQVRLERALCRARSQLDPRETFILDRRLLAEPEEMLSLGEIGQYFGVSRERVRQLEVRARAKLQSEALRDDLQGQGIELPDLHAA